MSIFSRRHRAKLLSRSQTVALIAALIAIFFVVGIVREAFNRHLVDSRIHELDNEAAKISRENTDLSSLISAWSSESHLEKEARLKLGLQKPGEKKVLIVRATTSDTASDNQLDPSAEVVGQMVVEGGDQESNMMKWWKYFFDK